MTTSSQKVAKKSDNQQIPAITGFCRGGRTTWLNGGKDQGIAADQVEDLRAGLARAGSRSLVHAYPDAPHAFHADYRPTYRMDAAEDGWKRLLEWLRKNGV